MPDPEPIGRPDDEQWWAGVVTDSRVAVVLDAYVEIKDNAKGTTQSTKADQRDEKRGTKRGTTVRFLQQLTDA